MVRAKVESIVENDSSLIGRDATAFPYVTGLHLFGKTELNLASPHKMVRADILDLRRRCPNLALHEHSAFLVERPVSELSWTKYARCEPYRGTHSRPSAQ
jgi:hypothetical protein